MTLDKSEHTLRSVREGYNLPTDSIPRELGRHLEEALRCLKGTDLNGANAALERACTEAASPRKGAGVPGYVGRSGTR